MRRKDRHSAGTQIEYGKVGGKTYENCRVGDVTVNTNGHARPFLHAFDFGERKVGSMTTKRRNDGRESIFPSHRGHTPGTRCDIHEKNLKGPRPTLYLVLWKNFKRLRQMKRIKKERKRERRNNYNKNAIFVIVRARTARDSLDATIRITRRIRRKKGKRERETRQVFCDIYGTE